MSSLVFFNANGYPARTDVQSDNSEFMPQLSLELGAATTVALHLSCIYLLVGESVEARGCAYKVFDDVRRLPIWTLSNLILLAVIFWS